jgi:hypothetical protein
MKRLCCERFSADEDRHAVSCWEALGTLARQGLLRLNVLLASDYLVSTCVNVYGGTLLVLLTAAVVFRDLFGPGKEAERHT